MKNNEIEKTEEVKKLGKMTTEAMRKMATELGAEGTDSYSRKELKQYLYIKIITTPAVVQETPAEVKLTITELKKMAKDLGVKNWWTMKRVELEQAITLTKVNSQEEEVVEDEKEEEESTDENIITLKEIIQDLKIKGTKARRILRKSDIERPYKRWEWNREEHKNIIQQIKTLLS